MDLPEHSSAAVKAFLESCYTGDYTCEDEKGVLWKPVKRPRIDIGLYQLAQYVLAERVKYLALNKVVEHMTVSLSETDLHIFWEEELAGIVDEVYSSGHEELCRTVMNVALNGLLEGRAWQTFNGVGQKHGAFAFELLGKYADEVRTTEKTQVLLQPGAFPNCTICGKSIGVSRGKTIRSINCPHCGKQLNVMGLNEVI